MIWLSFPAVSHAAIILNEIAWMGTTDSANYEWIELHNTSAQSVDVTDWALRDGGSLNISLSGSIAGGAYVLLERNRSSGAYLTSTPFVVYTGALVNTGATLTLTRVDGSVADQVSGGEEWGSIGGDNTTKDTAQYTDSGWITAAPTPAAPNAQIGSQSAANDTPTASARQSSGSGRTILTGTTEASSSARLKTTPGTLGVAVTAPTIAYVGQPMTLQAEPYGLGTTLLNSLTYRWNFGDSFTGGGATTSHAYRYPGTYVVTVSAAYGRFTAVGRHEVTVLPLVLSLGMSAAGEVQLHNDAPYEVDVSGYRLVGSGTLVLPPHTIMLPKSTIVIPRAQLQASAHDVFALYSHDRALVATTLPEVSLAVAAPTRTVAAQTQTGAPPERPVSSAASRTPPADSPQAPAAVAASTPDEVSVATSTFFTPLLPAAVAAEMAAANQVGGEAEAPPPAWWTYGGLALLIVGSVGFLWWQRRCTVQAD